MNCLSIGVALAFVIHGLPLWTIGLMMIASDWAIVIDVIRSIFPKCNTKGNTVPIHVENVVHREGEFTMLMVGEYVF